MSSKTLTETTTIWNLKHCICQRKKFFKFMTYYISFKMSWKVQFSTNIFENSICTSLRIGIIMPICTCNWIGVNILYQLFIFSRLLQTFILNFFVWLNIEPFLRVIFKFYKWHIIVIYVIKQVVSKQNINI